MTLAKMLRLRRCSNSATLIFDFYSGYAITKFLNADLSSQSATATPSPELATLLSNFYSGYATITV
ncbi:hypothetical protein WKK05_41490 (plasmid) [Nostoc sp. UHCC 0302]|uniref:hypothetical protein n=1 Tax=Nostoc sp. UHCC 0302 TaxID=3134896 RepID=UPI00311CE052